METSDGNNIPDRETSPEIYQGIKIKSVTPLVGLRKAIAEHMQRSLQTSAQVTVMGELDMCEMLRLRKELVAEEKTLGTRITFSDLFIFFLSRALREHPMVNASLIDGKIMVWDDINISIAVSIPDGLITPVLKNADQKSLTQISQQVKALAQKAKDRTLAAGEVRGGTFTLSNLGAVGARWRFDTIIINQPQSAILATGGITERAVVRDGVVVARPIMTYMLTYDHRLLEGGSIVTQFIDTLSRFLEHPNKDDITL